MKLFKDFLVIVFIPITLFLKIISPIIKVRWSKVYFPDRIGHLVAELEHYLHLTKNKSFFCLDLFQKIFSLIINLVILQNIIEIKLLRLIEKLLYFYKGLKK